MKDLENVSRNTRSRESESLLVWEVEELRGRQVQMEKTMKWWSECAASWREKWTHVRLERNKVAEEARDMREKVASLEKTMREMRKEIHTLKMELKESREREKEQESLTSSHFFRD